MVAYILCDWDKKNRIEKLHSTDFPDESIFFVHI